MGAIYTKTRELTAGNAGAPLSESHLTSHDNLDAEIEDISTALSAIDYTDWTSYVVTWASSGSQDIGNGTILGSYIQIGNMVTALIIFSPGDTTNFGGNDWTFSLPVTSSGTSYVGNVWALDSGIGYKTGVCTLVSTTTLSCYSNGSVSAWDNAIPMSWVEEDRMRIQISYRAA